MEKLFSYATKLNTTFDQKLFLKWVKKIVSNPDLLIALAVEYDFYDKISDGIATITKGDIEDYDKKVAFAKKLIHEAIQSECRFSFFGTFFSSPVCIVDVFIYDGELQRQQDVLTSYIVKIGSRIDENLSYDLPSEPQQCAMNIANDYLGMLNYLAE